jgi:hypothetical protein
MEAEEIHALASFSQMHDPRLVRLELQAQFGQDRGERFQGALGLGLGSDKPEQDIVGLCRVACYAE